MTTDLHPEFIKQMQQILGDVEWANWLKAFQEKPTLSIRYNPFKLKSKQDARFVDPVAWATQACYLAKRPNFTADPLFHAGTYYVQEASSMFLEQVLRQYVNISTPLIALDLCAAPGGKSTQILSVLGEDSILVSNEVIKSRAQILSENIQKWGTGRAWVSQNDPADFKKLKNFFDLIVVDAPCSGEGMFRKAPHSIKEWSPKNKQLCALRQERILHDIWGSLRPGGLLVYSTCTYNKQENEANLQKFNVQEAFESLPIALDPSWGVVETKEHGIYGYRFYPQQLRGEGFFLSVLQKKGEAVASYPKIKKPVLKRLKEKNPLIKYLATPSLWELMQYAEYSIAVPKAQPNAVQAIASVLKIIYPGMALAEPTKKGFKPLAGAALWTGLNTTYFPQQNLSKEQALEYLSLGIPNDLDDSVIGSWQLACYEGHPLGWLKRLPQRYNNYYPKYWKIRLSLDKLL